MQTLSVSWPCENGIDFENFEKENCILQEFLLLNSTQQLIHLVKIPKKIFFCTAFTIYHTLTFLDNLRGGIECPK